MLLQSVMRTLSLSFVPMVVSVWSHWGQQVGLGAETSAPENLPCLSVPPFSFLPNAPSLSNFLTVYIGRAVAIHGSEIAYEFSFGPSFLISDSVHLALQSLQNTSASSANGEFLICSQLMGTQEWSHSEKKEWTMAEED